MAKYEASPQLLNDLRAVDNTLEMKGWIRGNLAIIPEVPGRWQSLTKRLKENFGHDRKPKKSDGGCCMTGAVGVSVGTAEQVARFLRYAEGNNSPETQVYDGRGKMVMRALAKYGPEAYQREKICDENGSVALIMSTIVRTNDHRLNNHGARKWVQAAIEGVEAELREQGIDLDEGKRLKKEPKIEHVTPKVEKVADGVHVPHV